MSFEEEFPSLKGKVFGVAEDLPVLEGEKEGEGFGWNNSPSVEICELKNYCLDKQRVQEAIEKLTFLDDSCLPKIMVEDLLKELGL